MNGRNRFVQLLKVKDVTTLAKLADGVACISCDILTHPKPTACSSNCHIRSLFYSIHNWARFRPKRHFHHEISLSMQSVTEGHILKRYDGELAHLHYLVLEMGGLVVQQLRDALLSFSKRDCSLAERVINRESSVDSLEMGADEETIKLIARRSPVGSDLRVVMAVSKTISDLESIGDEAARIADLVLEHFGDNTSGHNNNFKRLAHDINRVGELALTGVQHAVELFDIWNEEKALAVIAIQAEMDGEFHSELRRVMTYVMEDSRNIGFAVGAVLLSKSLDRITHIARNIAQHAIFEIKGVDVR